MRRALLLLLALAVPALVHAQTTAGTITFVPDANIGLVECNPANGETIDVRWSVSSTSVGPGTYRVYASTRAPTADTTTNVKLCDTGNVVADGVWAGKIGSDITATSSASQSANLLASAFVTATAAPGSDTCTEGLTRTIYVCVHFFPLNQSTPTASATGQLQLDLTRPAKPTITGVSPGEEALRVDWDEGTGGAADTTYYRIQATATDTAQDAATHTSGKITGTSGRIEGLRTGVEYQVTVIAFSSADNASEPSDPKPGTPVPVLDFWEGYEATGGREQGGCASGPAGAAGLLGAALALALHRRRK
ncbi:MAG TPA: fibronectin type III domain-containing protein [Anaeromyxobacter sp.]|nr:fibronectin type III domain-containing protein [Anaeromyxobacter sp.]